LGADPDIGGVLTGAASTGRGLADGVSTGPTSTRAVSTDGVTTGATSAGRGLTGASATGSVPTGTVLAAGVAGTSVTASTPGRADNATSVTGLSGTTGPADAVSWAELAGGTLADSAARAPGSAANATRSVSPVPHFLQKRAPGATGLAQAGQLLDATGCSGEGIACASAVPQDLQNLALPLFCVPQLAHFVIQSPRFWRASFARDCFKNMNRVTID
jgi:hypothetical protein